MARPRTPEVTVDLVIELEDRPGRPIVVIRRGHPPPGHALPGGFVDIGETVEHAAMREAREETGLETLVLHEAAPRPLDVDVHEIPARPGEPAHAHLDLRYLVRAGAGALTRAQEEAADLRWFAWDELEPLRLDPGLRRGLAKALSYMR